MIRHTEASAILSIGKVRSRGLRRAISRHRTATALVGGLAATILLATPAMAQQTSGGVGGRGGLSEGAGSAGTSSDTGAGGAGGNGTLGTGGTGGGGGAGATGGKGGNGGASGTILGGNGGATAGAAGTTGGNANTQAGGGGGGAHGAVTSTVPVTAFTGGRGGNGGAACLNADGSGPCGGAGGGGGAGGYGVVFTSSGTFTFGTAMTGGDGGNGGKGSSDSGGGGDGGYGLRLTGAVTATITGLITGGNGGAVGIVQNGFTPHGTNGAGGAGIAGGDLNLTLQNTVTGGLNGDGVTRAAALYFTGGTNTLLLDTGWGLVGGIRNEGTLQINSAADATLAGGLSGSGAFTFAGAHTYTLTADSSLGGSTTISAGTSLQLGNGGSTGSLGSSAVNILGALSFNRSGTVTLNGVLSGNGMFTQNSSGTLTLTRVNSFSGDFIINSGLVQLSNAGALGTSRLAMNGGALRTAVNGTFSNALTTTGTNSISALSGTTVTLSLPSLTGSLAGNLHFGTNSGIDAGTVIFAPNNATIDPALNVFVDAGTLRGGVAGFTTMLQTAAQTQIAAGAMLDLNGTATTIANLQGAGRLINQFATTTINSGSFAGTIEFDASVTKSGSGTLILSGANSYLGGTMLTAGTLKIGNAAALGGGSLVQSFGSTLDLNGSNLNLTDFSGTGTVTNSAAATASILNIALASPTTTYSGQIQDGLGTVGLQLSAGNLVLSGANSYSGGTTITGGQISFGTASNLGAGAITLNGGALQWLGGNTADISAHLTIGASGGTLDIGNNNVTLASAITGPGALTKIGGGILSLRGANGFGDLDINAGLVNFASTGNLGTGTITLAGGGLQWASGTQTDISARLGAIDSVGGTFDTNGNDVTFATGLTGTGPITKTGTGTLILGAPGSITGGTGAGQGFFVSGGTLQIGDIGALGTSVLRLQGGNFRSTVSGTLGSLFAVSGTSGNVVSVAAGETLTIGGGSNGGYTTDLDGNVHFGTASDTGTIIFNVAGTASSAARVYVDGGTLRAGTNFGLLTANIDQTVITGGTLDLDGQTILFSNLQSSGGRLINDGGTTRLLMGDVAGSLQGTQALVKLGPDTLILSGANTYSGGTTLSGGTIQTGSLSALGFGSLTQDVGTTLDIRADLGIAGLDGDGTVRTDDAGHAYRLILAPASGTYSYAGLIEDGLGSLQLVKDGAGTQVLTGVNTYSGGTTIRDGMLEIGNASALGTGIVAFSGGSLRATTSMSFAPGLSWDDQSGASVLSVAANETLTLGGVATVTDSASNPASVRFGSATDTGTIVFDPTNTSSFSISDPGSLLAVEGGTLQAGSGNTGLLALANVIGTTSIDAGAILDLNGTEDATYAIRNLEGTGTLTNSALMRIAAGDFSGTITGIGGIEKVGTGTLILSGTNTFLGGTKISDGTLEIGNVDALSTGTVTVDGGTLDIGAFDLNLSRISWLSGAIASSGGALTVGNGQTFSLGGGSVLGGDADISVVAGGTLTLLGTNSFTGSITLAGRLEIGNSGAAGSGSTIFTTGSVINYADGVDNPAAIVIGSDTTQLEVLSGADASQSGLVSETGGSRGFEKIGDGRLTLLGQNSYTGETLISSGTLRLGDSGLFVAGVSDDPSSAGRGAIRIAGDVTLELGTGPGFFGVMQNAIVSDGTGGSPAIILGTGTGAGLAGSLTGGAFYFQSASGALGIDLVNTSSSFTSATVGSGVTLGIFDPLALGGSSVDVEAGGRLLLDFSTGAMLTNSLSGAGDLEIASDAQLGNLNSMTGATFLTGGITTLAANDALTSGDLSMSQFTAFNLNGLDQTVASLSGFANSGFPGSASEIRNDTVSASLSTLTISGTGADADFAGDLTEGGAGALALIKNGASIQTLSGTNTYSGGTTLNDGTLVAGSASAFGTGAFVQNGGTLDVHDQVTSVGSLVGTAGVLTNEGTGFGTLTVLGGSTRYDGQIVDGSSGGITALALASGADLTLGSANAFTGGITVTDATLRLANDNAAGGGGNTILTDGTLATIRFNNGVDNVSAIDLGAAGTELFVDTGETGQQSGAISGGNLAKTGDGTLTLTAQNSYSGTTSILGGTLAVTTLQGIEQSSLLEIGNGGTLQVQGNVALGFSDDFQGDLKILTGGGNIDVATDTLATFTGTAAFDATLTKVGAGTLILDTDGSGTGGIDVAAGTLGIANDLAVGTGLIKLANGTTLLNSSCGCNPLTLGNGIEIAIGGAATIDANGEDIVLAGALSGGDLIVADNWGGGAAILTNDNNTYGATRVESDATLQIGDGGTTGALGTGSLTVDGALVFNRSNDYTISAAMDGTNGALALIGTGKLILTGDSIAAITDIEDGTLQIGDGGTTGSLDGAIIAINPANTVGSHARLVVDRSNDIALTQAIIGSGSIAKLGAGTLTLDLAAGAFSGDISILGGTLASTFGFSMPERIDIGNGAQLHLLDSADVGYMTVLAGGGTIDTDGNDLILGGSVDFQSELTKTGSGALVIEDTPGYLTGVGSTGAGGINILAGTLALGSDVAAGTGILKFADGTTLANCGCNAIAIANEIRIAPAGTLTIDGNGENIDLTGAISGGNIDFVTSYAVPGVGSIITLDGANSYGATRIGANVELHVVGGTLGTGDLTFDSAPSDPSTPATLRFQKSASYTYGGSISGTGLVQVAMDTGSKLTLSGSNSGLANFTGAVELLSGGLVINGDFGDVSGNSASLSATGGSLGGSGVFHGNVTLGAAALNPGNSPGTLTIAGNLTLGSATILNYELGQPGTPGGANNDLVNVVGNLTLDGTLNVIASGAGYGPGYYRLFNYGTLSPNPTLGIGSIAGGLDADVLTNIAGQVNVRLGGPQAIQYWDGADTGASSASGGNGGDGTWNGTSTNWTGPSGYAINDSWRSQVGVFAGAAGGIVTVDGTQNFQELRFETDGYALRPLDANARLGTTAGFSAVDVSAGVTADIGVIIQGAAGLDKSGTGTLILSAANAYSGATDIAAGTLRLGINNALTDPTALTVSAGATFDLNGFSTHIGSLAGTGAVTLGGGRLDTGYNNSASIFGGTVTGADGGTSTFTKNGSGTLTLGGTIALGNGGGAQKSFFQVNTGTLQITGTGSLSADLVQNFSTIENSGTITAFSNFQTFITVTNAATGTINGTTQNFGSFDNYGTMNALQSIGGTATNHSTGVINGTVQTFTSFTSTGIINGDISNFGTMLLENQVNGAVANEQNGASITLTGITTGISNYNGVLGSLLDLAGFDTTIGSLKPIAVSDSSGTIQLGTATLTLDMVSGSAASDAVITGSGGLIKAGAGTQTLTGLNTYTGDTAVNAGTLTLNATGGLTSDVTVASGATFNSSGAVNGYVTNNGLLSLGGSSTLTSGLLWALRNNNGGVAHAAGTIDAGIQNAGSFFVDGLFTGVTRFDQAASGQLTLNHDFGVGELTGSGTVDTGFYTLSVGNGGASSTFDGTISGAGGLTKTGTGVFVLTADQSYTGQTTVSAGTLTLGLFGAITGKVVNNASFESAGTLRGGLYNDTGATAVLRGQADGLIENHGSVTLSGALFGNDVFEQASGGTFNLAGFNATLGALDGDGTINLGAGYLFVGGNGDSTSFAGSISGTGGFTKTGTGTMTLGGVSNYGGFTQITGGTLQLVDGGAIGTGNVYNDAILAFDGAIDRSFGNAISGSGSVSKTGTNLVTLTGANGYSGGTNVQGGSLGFDNSQALGSGTVALADGTRLRNVNGTSAVVLANAIQVAGGGMATLQGVDGSHTIFNGEISGGTARFGLSGVGATAFTLGVANSYGDTRIGGGVALTVDGGGTLGTGNTLFETSGVPSSLTFANGINYSYGGTISGSGSIVVDTAAPGVSVTLTGSNSAVANFTGAVTVETGKLVLGGDFGDVVNNTASLTLNGGSLGGSGVFHGDVTFGNATLSPGNSPGTLVIAGNLTLGAGTILNYELGEAGTVGGANNDLVNVGGNLTLDGTLNVIAQPGFGEGYYRLFNYGGAFTDNGLNLGSLPAGYTPTLLTSIAGQVNILFASSPQAIQYWDGTDLTGSSTAVGGDGGAGIWGGTRTNWTAPTGYGVNDSWRGQVAVFGGASGGAVTVQGIQAFQELRFTTDGYTIAGATTADGLTTTGGFSVVDVSNGVGATINAVISGTGGLTKTGAGTLSLGGTNSYGGDTTVSGGTLVLLSGGALAGAVVNDAAFDNRGIVAGLVTNNGAMISTGTLNGGLSNSGTASISGVLNGAVTNLGTGTISLTGTTTGIGAVTQAATASIGLGGFNTSFGSLAGAGYVDLGGGSLTLGGDNSSTSFGGAISGSGGVTKTGTGTFTLTGVNNYTGTTIVSAGTLQLSATGEIDGAVRNDATFNNAGWVGGLVTNTGTLASIGTLNGGLNNSGAATIAGTLTGAVTNSGAIGLTGSTSGIGAVTQTATGSMALNGFDTSIGSLAGAGSVDNGGASLFLGGNNSSTSFSGVISGSGALSKNGTGTFTLTGANTYTGLTQVSGGTLAVSTSGSIAGNVRNQANFTNAGTVTGVVQNDATLTSTGNLAGGLINNGTASLAGTVGTGLSNNGTVTFTGAATVAVLQQGAAGTFNLAGFGISLGAIAGSGAINLGSGALSIGSAGGNSSFAGTIAGTGSLTKTGSGTLVLTGAATQTGGTTIAGGTLQIGSGGTSGSLSGAVTNNGLLVLNRSDVVTLANVMSGTGGFVQAGSGTTTLTGANSYSGGTRVSAGRLRGDTTSLQGDIRIDSALEFAQTGTGTYAGSLLGAGTFEKTGVGTLGLTGNSSTFTGATNVIAGRMAINGLLSRSTVTVNNGATVGGTGTVGGLVVQSGGTIAPGNSVGTFNVAGNVLFQAGSLFAAEISAAGADKIQATGTAQLNGTLQLINLGGNYGINATFVLLHSDGGVSGTFATTNLANFGSAYRPKIIYTANEVQLVLAPNQLSGVLGTGVSLTYNQASTIGRIDAAVITGGYDPTALSALYNLAPAAIPAALDQLSGEIYADATRAALEDERVVRDAVTGRLAEAADLGVSGNGAWGQVIGSWGNVDSDGNAAGYDVNRTGMLMGLDAGGASDDGSWRAGVMGHYTRITVPADARGSRATIDRTGGGFYAGAAIGGLRVRTGATLSLLDLKARRNIAIPGLTTTERGKVQGVMLQTFGEVSYRIETGTHGFVEPYLAGSATRVSFGRFAESSGPVSLVVRSQRSVLGIAELGLRGEMPLAGGAIRLGGNVGLRTAFGDRTANPIIALTAAPNQAFNVHSAEIDRFAAAANLNLTADLSDALSLRIGYTGMLGSGAREHGGRATLSLKF